MARPVIARDSSLSSQDALNAIAKGIAAARSTDVFVNDAKGAVLALSITNASKAVPAGVRAITFWGDVAFRWRLNATADLVDGAYANANDVVTLSIDPDDTVGISTVQAILTIGVGVLTINYAFGT